MAVPQPSLTELRAHAELFHRERAAAGLPAPQQLVRLLEVACGPDAATAEARCRPYLLEKYAAYASWGLDGLNFDLSDPPERQFAALAADRFVVGVERPAQVCDGLVAQHETGIRHLAMCVSWPGMPQRTSSPRSNCSAGRSCRRSAG